VPIDEQGFLIHKLLGRVPAEATGADRSHGFPPPTPRWKSVRRYVLRNHNSTNGTFLDGVRCASLSCTRVGHRLGQTEMTFSPLESASRSCQSSADSFGELIGSSSPMRSLRMLERIAPTNVTVLLEARRERARSSRPGDPRLQPPGHGPFVCSTAALSRRISSRASSSGHVKARSLTRSRPGRALRARRQRHYLPRRDGELSPPPAQAASCAGSCLLHVYYI